MPLFDAFGRPTNAASILPGLLRDFGDVAEILTEIAPRKVLVSAGVMVLRRSRPDLERGFRAPWVPLLPIASIGACLWLMLNLTALTWVRFAVWLVVGTAIYVGYGRWHSVQGRRDVEQARLEPTRTAP